MAKVQSAKAKLFFWRIQHAGLRQLSQPGMQNSPGPAPGLRFTRNGWQPHEELRKVAQRLNGSAGLSTRLPRSNQRKQPPARL